ncbi:hypothetical protein ABT084_11280 [Streptomyces sp. NPDC002138]|uniref:hypothetical protein n=1 Tax=Streptomyces sp. NPDC002138 TaxID=3154410 RepID=UPI00332D7654
MPSSSRPGQACGSGKGESGRAGRTTSLRDVLEFLRRAGLDPDDVRLDAALLIE